VITVAPFMTEITDTTPLGTTVAMVVVTMSDGSPFTGTIGFGSPYYNAGGIFSLSPLTYNPNGSATGTIFVSGPGVGSNMATITDYITLVATA
jgi:hypothetical protein